VIDDFNREALGIEIDFSLPSERVIRELKTLQQSGCGLTTMTAPIWPWADSHLSSDWPWLRNAPTSNSLAKKEDYPYYYWTDLREVQGFATK
jgi:putative transposase